MRTEDSDSGPGPHGGAFATTHWSVVLTAGHDSSPGARAALEQLCRAYWYPLYCYVQRQVACAADAEDLTQSFFAHLLERNALAKVSQDKGRFRSFLLASLRYFLADEWDKMRARKRGGGCVVISLNETGAEERYQRERGHELTAEELYERRWAMAVLERASIRLQEEFTVARKTMLGEELRGLHENGVEAGPYVEVAARLGMPVNTLKSHVHRYRRRFRELLCEEVAQTVAPPADVADELRRLIAVVRGQASG
ncbi:MAG: RNA polymerase sigma factor [Verrucomicrobiia bacterium]